MSRISYRLILNADIVAKLQRPTLPIEACQFSRRKKKGLDLYSKYNHSEVDTAEEYEKKETKHIICFYGD